MYEKHNYFQALEYCAVIKHHDKMLRNVAHITCQDDRD